MLSDCPELALATRSPHVTASGSPVVIDGRGDRHLLLSAGPGLTVVLSTGQSSLLALILTGALDAAEPAGFR